MKSSKMPDYLYTSLSTGYKVFITIPGVVTHKVPFNVDPSFYGEYDFLAHGLHYITASTPFLEWNKENQVCTKFFPSKNSYIIRPWAVGIKETGRVIADQITLFQSGGADFAHPITTPPSPGF